VSAVPVPVLNVPSALPSISRGPSLNTSRFRAAMVATPTTRVALGAPTAESSSSTVTCAGTSGSAFETTSANCCDAALSEGDTIALSRSAAQYSQPTFDCWRVASAHRSTHTPRRQAIPFAPSHVSAASHAPPCASQRVTLGPSQRTSPGAHDAHARSDGAHTSPRAAQSSPAIHEGAAPPHVTSTPPWHSVVPAVHAGGVGSTMSR
jgi:hypothetical protein